VAAHRNCRLIYVIYYTIADHHQYFTHRRSPSPPSQ
jgi:hypothetical protein